MTSYLVTWEIDVEAKNEIDAAYEAREIMQDKDSEALSFIVRSAMNTVDVDLYKLKLEKEETRCL